MVAIYGYFGVFALSVHEGTSQWPQQLPEWPGVRIRTLMWSSHLVLIFYSILKRGLLERENASKWERGRGRGGEREDPQTPQ